MFKFDSASEKCEIGSAVNSTLISKHSQAQEGQEIFINSAITGRQPDTFLIFEIKRLNCFKIFMVDICRSMYRIKDKPGLVDLVLTDFIERKQSK